MRSLTRQHAVLCCNCYAGFSVHTELATLQKGMLLVRAWSCWLRNCSQSRCAVFPLLASLLESGRGAALGVPPALGASSLWLCGSVDSMLMSAPSSPSSSVAAARSVSRPIAASAAAPSPPARFKRGLTGALPNGDAAAVPAAPPASVSFCSSERASRVTAMLASAATALVVLVSRCGGSTCADAGASAMLWRAMSGVMDWSSLPGSHDAVGVSACMREG